MNASYNASIRCVNFSVTFFFHRALLWNMDCSIFWMWRLIARFQWLVKRPRRWTNGEHWVHVQNKSTDHICSLLSRFSFVLQRNFSHTKIFEDVFCYALWLAVFTAIAQPFKISITDDVTSGWVGFLNRHGALDEAQWKQFCIAAVEGTHSGANHFHHDLLRQAPTKIQGKKVLEDLDGENHLNSNFREDGSSKRVWSHERPRLSMASKILPQLTVRYVHVCVAFMLMFHWQNEFI